MPTARIRARAREGILLTFDDLHLSPELLRAVGEAGYSEPTPIQAAAIPTVLMGRDLIGVAQTGTGKTAAFVLPMIDVLGEGRARARMPRSLILEPTRELAAQVAENFEKYGKYHKLSMALLIGGVSFGDQDRALEKGVDVLIATPGRLMDQFERGKILLSGVDILVIDEADRMLDMGFIPDVEKICTYLKPQRQTLLFSATMPAPVRKLADRFMTTPRQVEVSRPASTSLNIAQSIEETTTRGKRDALERLLREEGVRNAIIFANRKTTVRDLAQSLKKAGFNVGQIHGDMEQPERIRELERFKADEIQILAASDVAARGLDIKGVSHVFNYDVPWHPDDYVHRIGRTGRAGATGIAITLAAPADAEALANIEKLTGQSIPRRGRPPVADRVEDTPAPMAAPAAERPQRQRRRAEPDRQSEPARAETVRQPDARRPDRTRRPEPDDEPVLNELPAFLAKPIRPRRGAAEPAPEPAAAAEPTRPAKRAAPKVTAHPFGDEGLPAFLLHGIHV